jgi:hypothetical protein
MTIQGIKCNICGDPMPERITRQISVNLEPRPLPNGHFQQVIVQFLAGGMEYVEMRVPDYDAHDIILGTSLVKQEVVKATEFDVCLKCHVISLEEALRLVKN